MTYQTFTTAPEYVRFDPNAPKPAAGFLWSNDAPPPAIGTDIEIGFNNLGRATVTGYFAEDQFLGLLVRIHDAPDWHREQNKGNPTGHIFGAEIRRIFDREA